MSPLRITAYCGAGVALIVAVSIAFLAPRNELDRLSHLRGTPVLPPRTAVDFVLTDGRGRAEHILNHDNPLTFLFFGYTHCPDACPLAMASLGRAYRRLTAAQADGTRIVFVTVDPKRDTPRVVDRYVASFDPRIVGLTGSLTELERVWRSYGIVVDAKTREIGHGDAIYAIDRNARVLLEYPSSVNSADLAADAAILASSK